jgi:hypothetical protein
MGKKTVLRRLCKTLRISLQVMELIDREDALENQPVPVQGAASATAQVRQQVQARLGGQQAADTSVATDDAAQATAVNVGATAVPVADVAHDVDAMARKVAEGKLLDDADQAAHLDESSSESAKVRQHLQAVATCGATVADSDDVWHCGLTVDHRGMHSDGQHDWPNH